MQRPRSRSPRRPPGPPGDAGTQPPHQNPHRPPYPPGQGPGHPNEGPRPSGRAPRGPFEPAEQPPRGPFESAGRPSGSAERAGKSRRPAKGRPRRGGQARDKASKRRPQGGPQPQPHEEYLDHADQQEFEPPPEPPRRSRGPGPAGGPGVPFGPPSGPPPSDTPRATTVEGFEDELDRAFAGAQRDRFRGLIIGGAAIVLAVVLAVVMLFVWDPGGGHAAVAPRSSASPSGTSTNGGPAKSPSAAPSTQPPTSPPYIPDKGTGKFTLAKGGDVTGRGDKVMRYKVAVEGGLKQDPEEFAKEVDDILGDPRGWTATGKWAFKRVDSGSYEFIVKLSSPDTTDKLCGAYGMDTEGKVNCRAGKQVVVNLKRWLLLTKYYKGKPHAYHALTINHEVGHRLGHGHMTCPEDGAPAPVMMQQIYGLKGCVANPWPYDENGEYIKGPAVAGR